MQCSQCQNLAMYKVGEWPLCLHCYSKLQQTQSSQNESLERMLNYLHDQMDNVVGFSTGAPRFPERRPPVIQNAPVTINTMHIDRSIVGSVNTGYINDLEVSMQSVTQINNEGIEKVKAFAEAVLRESTLDKEQKESIIQQLDFLSQQLQIEKDKRNHGAVRAVISGVSSAINLSASLMTLWGPVAALFLK